MSVQPLEEYDLLAASGPRAAELVKKAIDIEISEFKFMEHINVFEEELGIPYSVLRGCANGKANIWTLFA